MSRTVSTYEGEARLSAYIAEVVRTGEALVITRHGKPVARLVPEPPSLEPEAALDGLRARDRLRLAGRQRAAGGGSLGG